MSLAAFLQQRKQLTNPYPGLRPFEPGEAHLFFGRDEQIEELIDRLKRHRLVAVVGWSGSGKSSLVKAGLIPLLGHGSVFPGVKNWRTVIMHPGDHPIAELSERIEELEIEGKRLDASPLRQSSFGLVEVARQLPLGDMLLVVADQFEELFRYREAEADSGEGKQRTVEQADEAARFVQLLLTASEHNGGGVNVVLTMRSDYLGDCADFHGLPEALNDTQYLVPRMTREQRRQAIEGPLGSVTMAPALVQRLINDTGDEPDQLPLLQHALMRIWDHWRGTSDDPPKREIGLADFDNDNVGTLKTALDLHAEELLKAPVATMAVMWPRPREAEPPTITETIFKRLTAIGRGRRERRDPAQLKELWSLCGAVSKEERLQVTAVLDHFRLGGATFLTPRQGELRADSLIDITHESLIRQWRRLNTWAEEERASSKMLMTLAERSRQSILTDLDLRQALEWRDSRNPTAEWAQHYFADPQAVLDYIARSQTNEEYRVRNEARAAGKLASEKKKKRVWIAAAAITLIVAGAEFAVLYFRLRVEQSNVLRQAEIANQLRIISQVAEDRAKAAENKARAATAELQAQKAIGQERDRLVKEAQQYKDRAAQLEQKASKVDSLQSASNGLLNQIKTLDGQLIEARKQIRTLDDELTQARAGTKTTAPATAAMAKEFAKVRDESNQRGDLLTLIVMSLGGWAARRLYLRR